MIDPWMQASRCGRVDVADVCSAPDCFVSGAVTSRGGRALQYIHSNTFDPTTEASTDKLKEDLLAKKQRAVWMTPLCTL